MFPKYHLYLRDRMNHLFLKNPLFLGDLVVQLLLKYLKYHLHLKGRMNHLFPKFHLFLGDLVDLLGL